jgi:hypothetical protein
MRTTLVVAVMAIRIHRNNHVANLGYESLEIAQTLSRQVGVKASWLWYLSGTSAEGIVAEVETWRVSQTQQSILLHKEQRFELY